MRVRTNGGSAAGPSECILLSTGPGYTLLGYGYRPVASSVSMTTPVREEVIADVKHGLGKMNSCVHYRRLLNWGISPVVSVHVRTATNVPFLFAYEGRFAHHATNYGQSLPDLHDVSSSLHHSPETLVEDWEVPNYSAEAVQAMWPDVKANLSLINSLIELKDIKRMRSLYEATKRSLRDVLQFIGSVPRKGTLRRLLSAAAGHHLNVEFNVRPLLADLEALAASLDAVDRRVDQLLANEGKPFVSHFSKSLPLDIIGVEEITEADAQYVHYGYVDCHKVTLEVPRGVKYAASMSYTYTYSRYAREHARVLGRLDALGIKMNPAIVWNAIRFSFVVDWIAKVGNFLDQMSVNNLRPLVSINGFCHSIKYEVVSRVLSYPYQQQVDTENPYYSFPNRMPGAEVHRSSATYYVRRRVVPDFYHAIQLSGISPREILLSASLFASRL